MRMPLVRKAEKLRYYQLDAYEAVLVKVLESAGAVEYRYILSVFRGSDPLLFVTSEANAMAEEIGGGSHFLGLFRESGHTNLGSEDVWGELEPFVTRALEIAQGELGTSPAVAVEEQKWK